jgi:hypothetical protein
MSTFTVDGMATVISQEDSGGETIDDQTGNEEDPIEEEEPLKIRPAHLVLNELFYDANGDETDGQLFVELYGEEETDISDYSIVFINGSNGVVTESIELPEGSLIAPDGLFLIADKRTGTDDQTNVPNADLLDNFDPQNGPDCVQLLDHNSALLDAVGYGEPLPEVGENGLACFEGLPAIDASAGQSISRLEGSDTNDNVTDFQILETPTPGIL